MEPLSFTNQSGFWYKSYAQNKAYMIWSSITFIYGPGFSSASKKVP